MPEAKQAEGKDMLNRREGKYLTPCENPGLERPLLNELGVPGGLQFDKLFW